MVTKTKPAAPKTVEPETTTTLSLGGQPNVPQPTFTPTPPAPQLTAPQTAAEKKADKAAKKAEKKADIDVSPHGTPLAGNTYTASIPAPENHEDLFFHVNGSTVTPSFSDGMARGTFLAQSGAPLEISFTQGDKTIASKTLAM